MENIKRIEIFFKKEKPKVIIETTKGETVISKNTLEKLGVPNAIKYVNDKINIEKEQKKEINKVKKQLKLDRDLTKEEIVKLRITKENIQNRYICSQTIKTAQKDLSTIINKCKKFAVEVYECLQTLNI